MKQESETGPKSNTSSPEPHRDLCFSGAGAAGVTELFNTAVEEAPNGMLAVNTEGAIVLVNQQIERMFGYSREELKGRPVECLIPESLREDHAEFRTAFLGQAEARPMGAGRDLNGRRKDGTEFPLEIGLNPIEGPDGPLVLASVVPLSTSLRTGWSRQTKKG